MPTLSPRAGEKGGAPECKEPQMLEMNGWATRQSLEFSGVDN
jgi:hypothetical protein